MRILTTRTLTSTLSIFSIACLLAVFSIARNLAVAESAPSSIEVTDNKSIDNVHACGALPLQFDYYQGAFTVSIAPTRAQESGVLHGISIKDLSFSELIVTEISSPSSRIGTLDASPTRVELIASTQLSDGQNVAILIDGSRSMASVDPALQRCEAAIKFADSLRPIDTVALLEFGSEIPGEDTWFFRDFTYQKDELTFAIRSVRNTGSSTPLFHAVSWILDYVNSWSIPNVSILILSDGHASDAALYQNVTARLSQVSIPTYVVAIGGKPGFTELQYVVSRSDLRSDFISVRDPNDLIQIVRSIVTAITTERLVVYGEGNFNPPLPEDGQYRITGGLEIQTRDGKALIPFEILVEIPEIQGEASF